MAMDPQDMAMQAQDLRAMQEDPSLETSQQFDPTQPVMDPQMVPPGAPPGMDMGGMPPEIAQLMQDPAMMEQAMQDPQLGPMLQQMMQGGGGQPMAGQPPNPIQQIQDLHLQASMALLQEMLRIIADIGQGKTYNLDMASKAVSEMAGSYKTLMEANNQKEEIPPELAFEMEQAKLKNQLDIENARLQIELERANMEMQFKQREADLKLQMMQQQMEMKWEEGQAKLQLESQKAQLQTQQKDEAHFQQLSQQQEQHSQQLSMQEEQQEMQKQQEKNGSSE
jgi:hypothetical protein